MFAPPKTKKLTKCVSSNNFNTPSIDERSKITNVLYKTVIDSFDITTPNIRIAEEITNFINKSKVVNENKVKAFIGKMSVIASSIKQKEYQINEGLKNKKNEELLRNSYILPNIPVKEIEKADTVSQDSVLPQNFTINQIIKNNPYLKKEIKLNRSEEKINHDSYYDSKYKIDSNHFYEQQRLNKQQKKVRQMKYKEDLEEQIKQKIDKNIENERKELEIEMKILAMPEAQRQKEMNKEYIKDLNMIFQDKMRQKLIDYRTEKSLDKELVKMYLNEVKSDKNKAFLKRQMNKDLLEENKKLDEQKKSIDFLEKEKQREEELKYLAEQENLINKTDTIKEKQDPLKEEINCKVNKSIKGHNTSDIYEETLRKLKIQSINKCNEIEEKILMLEHRLEKERGKIKLSKLPVQYKDTKILRPLYSFLGTDNHVSKWKGHDETNKRSSINSKSVGVENFKTIKLKNSPEFFSTQIDKK